MALLSIKNKDFYGFDQLIWFNKLRCNRVTRNKNIVSKCLKLSDIVKIPSVVLLRTRLDASHKFCTVAVAACRRVRHSQMPQHHHKPQNIKYHDFMSRVKRHNDPECLRSSYLYTAAQWAPVCGLAGRRAEVYANVLGDRSGTGGWRPLAVAVW